MRLTRIFLLLIFIAANAIAFAQKPTTVTVRISGQEDRPVTLVFSGDEPTTSTMATEDGSTSETIQTDPVATLRDLDKAFEDFQSAIREIDTLQWIQAVMAILLGLVFQRVFKAVITKLSGKKKEDHTKDFRSVFFRSIRVPVGWFPVVVGIAAAGWSLGLNIGTVAEPTIFRSCVVTLIVINITWIVYNMVDVLTYILKNFAKRTDTPLDDELVPLIHKTMKVAVLVMGVVTLGSYVGGPFKGILAGVGLGGLAVALAARDTLANFFGYVVLFLDRPFAVGDRISVAGSYGDVEDVGLRSTKIRTRDRTLVSIPNSLVANESIENYSKRPARKVDMAVGVTYTTNAEQMEKLVEAIREILGSAEGVEQGTWCLGFNEFGASSLDIRIRFYTKDILLPGHLATRQRVNLAIMRTVAEHGLSMAFPTRTLYLQQDPDGQPLFPTGNKTVNSE